MQRNFPNITVETRFIPLREVERRFGRSKWWVRDEIAAGRFPKPVHLGPRLAFVETEIEQHQQKLIAKRDKASLQGEEAR